MHSNIGSDHDHVDEQLAFFESLPWADLVLITSAAYETAELLARQPRMDQALTDEEIGRRLEKAGIRAPFSRDPEHRPHPPQPPLFERMIVYRCS